MRHTEQREETRNEVLRTHLDVEKSDAGGFGVALLQLDHAFTPLHTAKA